MNNTTKTVPVIVDANKNLDQKITRCVYFTMDAVLPDSSGIVTIENVNMPLIIIGLTGIICQPDHESIIFESPNQIETLFDRIEDMEGMVVSVSDIIFPTSLLRINDKAPNRGDVYRVGHNLMYLSYLFQTERMEILDYFSECEKYKEQVKLSFSEKKAFKDWSIQQINRSMDNYNLLAEEDRVLFWKDSQ